MFGFIKKIAKVVKGAHKLVKPFAGVAVLMIPGAAQAQAGIQLADNVVKGYNSLNPRTRRKAQRIVAAQKQVLLTHPNPRVRQEAAHGMTLMRKRAAALKASQLFDVNSKGIVVRVSAAKSRSGKHAS